MPPITPRAKFPLTILPRFTGLPQARKLQAHSSLSFASSNLFYLKQTAVIREYRYHYRNPRKGRSFLPEACDSAYWFSNSSLLTKVTKAFTACSASEPSALM